MNTQHQADAHDATQTLNQADYDNRPQHTPGPWVVTGSNGYLNQTGIGERRDRAVIPVGCVYGDPRSEEIKANARLVAAAPELLALVRRAVDVLQRHAPPDGLSDHDALRELYSIFDGSEYRAAMTKAVRS